ncbi:lysophospholipid acyltransferase family protein [Amycolatopsis regifaucium]|uniref:1-acyl-sn-glycerol-3-phosphate acyltransferase n=1 Tax=Amycolatopsis regifaucium TaxID=546365 RepID=A0A154MJB1_9PSEU|nr:lysophospholipid acyltransferase family protein [Amycolatopsis regifaucium]KZB84508.1 acyl-phosphate glycerol 3-phosphate acyltransferase [Amycolatopsis regifaucium]OKA10971.1 1-acyl-sn-glycerol-3-phosphate acyltransferase [Amycolatopsis regifaucium]SFI23883.1 1-acyl-sn-glycerol-3-phosphate acyltransferase [Amycolatopsis regifaucium]
MLYWLMKHVFIGPLLKALWPTKVVGAENIPETGGAILAGNHLAVADSFFMPLRVKRKVTFPAKSEYFTEKGFKGLLKKWFFTGVGQFPIDRSGGNAAQAALDTATRLVREGHLLGIYPEGTRSPDGRLYKGKTGVARIALDSGGVVIPVVMIGTDKVNPIGSKMWWPRRLEIRFGKPLDFSRYEGLAGDRFIERSITDEIMYALMELSGQEYVDIYAAKAKELLAAEEAGIRPKVPSQLSAHDVARIPDTKVG